MAMTPKFLRNLNVNCVTKLIADNIQKKKLNIFSGILQELVESFVIIKTFYKFLTFNCQYQDSQLFISFINLLIIFLQKVENVLTVVLHPRHFGEGK
jgi:hypothetical protein